MDNNANKNVKKLMRSRTNRTFMGVCGGIGNYFGVDPVIIRLAWVALTLFTFGTGVIAYIVAAIVIPEEN